MSFFPEVNTFKVTVPASRVKTLNANPFLLVSGVSNGIVDLKSCYIQYNFNTIPFGPILSGDLLGVFYGIPQNYPTDNTNTPQAGELGFQLAAGFIDQTASRLFWQEPVWSPGSVINPVNLRGQGLYLSQYNDGQGTYPSISVADVAENSAFIVTVTAANSYTAGTPVILSVPTMPDTLDGLEGAVLSSGLSSSQFQIVDLSQTGFIAQTATPGATSTLSPGPFPLGIDWTEGDGSLTVFIRYSVIAA